MWEPFLLYRAQALSSFLIFLFLSVLPVYVEAFLSLGHHRSSVSMQQLLCMNRPARGGIFNDSVKGGDLCFLLLHHLDSDTPQIPVLL